jgi:uncharacterized membrane protein
VLNTDLLLNLTSLVLAFAVLSLVAVLCGMLVSRMRWLYWPLTVIVMIMLWLPLSGNLLLLLMKLQVMPLLKPLLSFVARVTNNAQMYNWFGAGLLAARPVLAAPLTPLFPPMVNPEPIAHRLALLSVVTRYAC